MTVRERASVHFFANKYVPFFSFFCGACMSLTAGPQPLHTNAQPVAAGITNAPIKKIGDGLFQIGAVVLNKAERTVTLPAVVNMREGNIEYVLVHNSGKVHESLLKTDAEPFHINVALLLLGAKGGEVKTKTPDKPTSNIAGEPIQILLSWTNGTNQVTQKGRAEDWVWDAERKATATHGDWLYNGSRIIDGTFLAQRDGSIVSVIADPDALLNNPRPGRDHDDAWLVNTTNTPPVNTAVQVIFLLRKLKEN